MLARARSPRLVQELRRRRSRTRSLRSMRWPRYLGKARGSSSHSDAKAETKQLHLCGAGDSRVVEVEAVVEALHESGVRHREVAALYGDVEPEADLQRERARRQLLRVVGRFVSHQSDAE